MDEVREVRQYQLDGDFNGKRTAEMLQSTGSFLPRLRSVGLYVRAHVEDLNAWPRDVKLMAIGAQWVKPSGQILVPVYYRHPHFRHEIHVRRVDLDKTFTPNYHPLVSPPPAQ